MSSTTVVAEEGNLRKGGMTRPEVEQCVLDIANWFRKHSSSSSFSSSTGDSPEECIERIEKLFGQAIPYALSVLLTRWRETGGIWFMDKPLLPAAEVYTRLQRLKLDVLPFCGHTSEDMLVITATGAVCEWDEEDGCGDEIASSLNAYLEEYRNFLLEGNCEFIKDCGVVEKMATRRK